MRGIFLSVLNRSLPIPRRITNETRKQTKKESHRFRGSVRISNGNFYTDDEYENQRQRILNTPLP
jgi:hypothetical protein